MSLPDELISRIDGLAGDNYSGASSLLTEALAILETAQARGVVVQAGRALCRAQPSMACIWNAAIAATAGRASADALQRFRQRWQRAPAALARFATAALLPESPGPMRLVTTSASGTVMAVARALAAERQLQVSCGEGRPALEGRRLAAGLAAAGITVDLFTDAGLGGALDAADAVVVGADAVGVPGIINKAGTGMLSAAALHKGVPVHVLATSDKLAMPSLWPHLTLTRGTTEEIWNAAPAGVTVHNPYFEVIPRELVTTVITDIGVLGIDMVPAACAALETPAARLALDELLDAL